MEDDCEAGAPLGEAAKPLPVGAPAELPLDQAVDVVALITCAVIDVFFVVVGIGRALVAIGAPPERKSRLPFERFVRLMRSAGYPQCYSPPSACSALTILL